MSDLLSAASLFLAVLGVLFALWYPEISKALELKIPAFKEDRAAPLRAIRAVYLSRVLPLSISAIIFSVVLIPDVWRITAISFFAYRADVLNALWSYSAVETLFCCVFLLSLFLSGHLIVLTIKLRTLLRRLEG